MHEGKIHANSMEGRGSEFIITLPVRLVDKEQEEKNLNNKEVFDAKYEENLSIEFSDIYK